MDPVTSAILTLAYQDSTSRNYTFTGIEDSEVGEIADRIKAINANMPATFAQTFVSSTGAPCVMIAAAKVVTVEDEVIYSAG